ncbi:PHP domain-containing protein, partial [Streptomyces sp. CC228A]|uniref:PHP domain-containing protein n=1 Tax=Streptomyces sp. CC228A TaxID=2898186 RepID=UPI001F39B353
GVGPKTAQVVREALAGEVPGYLRRLEDEVAREEPGGAGAALREALRGDCHTHSDWSDGGSPIEEMGRTAAALGHAWVALTDHSPRLTVARGLSAERLREQLDVVAELNERWAPFRMLTGIEVDILPDGSLDQEPELLERLDVVVASVHSKLRMDAPAMTRRMVRAVRSPLVDVLGHCTGRLVTGGRGRRPESEFDADRVFAACAESGTAVEVNSRPERLDPPRRLLRRAVAAGTLFAIDTDAHAPGQLDWQVLGCARAEECGVPAERVVTAWPAERLLAWTRTGTVPEGV